MDKDLDGQLREQELRQYIGHLAPEYSNSKLDQLVAAVIGRLDSPDQGHGVDWNELERHLHTLLQDVQVADWVTYGLGLPQYEEAFRSNAVTALDLPMLVNDGGQLLQTELQVESPLHRQKLLRAMQRQLLGLGSPPGPIPALHCACDSTTTQHQPAADSAAAAVAGAVVCSWRPPADMGQPAMHTYVLQRLEHSAAGAVWQTVASLGDSLSVRYRDAPLPRGLYQYRVAAWNVYGRSRFALSGDVSVPAAAPAAGQAPLITSGAAAAAPGSLLQAPLHHQVDLAAGQPAAAVLQGGACPAGGCLQHPDGLVHEQQQQQQQQGQQQGLESSSGHSCTAPTHQGTAPGQVVWVLGMGEQLQHSTPATAAGRAAQRDLATSMRAAAAAAAVGAGKHGGAAAAGVSSKRSGAARLAALLGSVWHSSMGGWLRAAINSFLLLVVPICVRLLPLHVLSHAAQLLAKLLQCLPGPLQQRLLLRQRASSTALSQQEEPDGLLLQSVASSSSSRATGLRSSSSHGGAAPVMPRTLDGTSSPASASFRSSSSSRSLVYGRSKSFGGRLTDRSSSVQEALDGPSDSLASAAARAPAGHEVSAAVGSQVMMPGSPMSPCCSPAAAAPRRGLPRSVSAFDLARQGLCASPGPSSAKSVSFACSPADGAGGPAAVGNSLGVQGSSGGGSGSGAGVVAATDSAVMARQAPGSRPGSALRVVGVQQLLPYTQGATTGATAAAAAALSVPNLQPCSSSVGLEQPGQVVSAWPTGQADQEWQRFDEYDEYDSQAGLPDKTRCGFPGCTQQFGLRHLKATLQRHYCGRCQQAFCLQHTAYSPHGTSGTCGVQSRCLCIDCFYEYTPEYQAFLASRNTLVGKRSKSGPPAAAAAVAAAGSGWEAGGVRGGAAGSVPARVALSRLLQTSLGTVRVSSAGGGKQQQQQQHGTSGADVWPQQQETLQQEQQQELCDDTGRAPASGQAVVAAGAAASPPAAAASDGGVAAATVAAAAAATPVRHRSLGPGASVPGAGFSKGLKSRMLWGRGLTKTLGLVRFKHAGHQAHEGDSAYGTVASAAAGGGEGEGACMTAAAGLQGAGGGAGVVGAGAGEGSAGVR